MNYKKSSHYKFGIVVGYVNIFVSFLFIVLEWQWGVLKPGNGAGAGLAMCAITVLVLSTLGILNIIFNIMLYDSNDREIEWDNFPKDISDYFYLYFFGFFHMRIEKRLGWFIFSLPFIFIWTFISQILLLYPMDFIARILYNLQFL